MSSRVDQHLHERLKHDRHPKGYPFVTISRQAGAGGRRLAQAVLRTMEAHRYHELFRGWKIVDRILCEEVLEDPAIRVSIEELVTEEYRSLIEDFFADLFGQESPQFTVYRHIFQIQRMFAVIGKVILVGRAANQSTRDLPGGLHLRLVAPDAQRLQRMVEITGQAPPAAEKIMRKQDQQRRTLYRDYFNQNIDNPSGYDYVWDTNGLSFETMAAQVVEEILKRAHAIGRA